MAKGKTHWYDLGRLLDNVPENEKRKCSVDGCNNKRVGISRYCLTHRDHQSVFGTPVCRSVPLGELMPYIEEAADLIKLNPNHPGIKIANSFFKSRHDAHEQGKSFKFGPEYWLIYENRPIEVILARLAGVYILRQRDEANRLYPTETSLHVGLFRVLSGHLPYKQSGLEKSNKLQHKHMGRQIAEKLGLLLLSMARAADARKVEQNQLREGLGARWDLGKGVVFKQAPKRKFVDPSNPDGKPESLAVLARRYGRNITTVRNRVQRGWSLTRALTTSPDARCQRAKRAAVEAAKARKVAAARALLAEVEACARISGCEETESKKKGI